MSVVPLLARRSSAPWGAALIAVSTICLALAAVRPGMFLWSDLVTGMSSASVYTGSVAAGVGAFEGGRWATAHRDRLRFSGRSSLRATSVHAVSVLVPLVSGFGVSLVVAAIIASIAGAYGEPHVWWLLALSSALVLAGTVGYAVGTLAGHRWYVAPMAAVGFFAAFIAIRGADVPFGVVSLFPAVTNTDSVFVRYVTSTMVGQTLAWVGLAVALVLLAGDRTRIRRGGLFVAIVLLAGAVFAGAMTVLSTNGQYTTGHNPRDFECRDGAPMVCLNRGYTAAMDTVQSGADRLGELTVGTRLYPHRLEQNVEGVGDEPARGSRSLYLEQFDSVEDVEFALFRYVTKYGGSAACDATTDSSTRTAVLLVDAWLSGYDSELADSGWGGELNVLRSSSTEDGNRWFQQVANDYFTCSLSLADLP